MVQARAAASVVASCKKQNLARPDAVNEDTSAGAAAAPAAATPRKPPNNMRRSSSMQPPKDYKFSWVARMLRQRDVREAYRHPRVQWGIAVLIMGNFITNLIEKQMDPTGSLYHESWKIVENCWNSIFVVELAWNMWAHWAMTAWKWRDTVPPFKVIERHFLCSGWNLFDTLVVAVSVPSLLGIDLGSFSQMRMLRAFRVFRLFKRIKSLNKIIVSLTNAVPGLINAAIVQILVMCIYAILAVDLFRDFGKDGTYINLDEEEVSLVTSRGLDYGHEYFGNFFRSLYTLFQVLTGESWSEIVARPILMSQGSNQLVGGIFFVSYIVICGIILVNVAVAVLLEKMVDLPDKDDDDDEEESSCVSLSDLPDQAAEVLSVLDLDSDGVLSMKELQHAAELLKKDIYMNEMSEKYGEKIEGESGLAKELKEQLAAAAANASEMRPHLEKLAALDLLREESREQDARLQQALEAEKKRSEDMQQQIMISVQALANDVQALQQTMLAMQQRSRRKPPGSRTIAPANGSSSSSSNVPASLAPKVGDEEDRVQDGVRTISKQAPDRVQQRL